MSTDILYTTTDQIVAALGLTSHDLEEQQLVAMDLEPEVTLWLYSWLPTYATVYGYGALNAPSATQTRQYMHLILSVKYYCAYLVAPRLQMIAPKTVETEAGNNMSRADVDPKDIQQVMTDRYTYHVNQLLNEINQTTTVASVRGAAITAVSPFYDPFTSTT
jgi:hypothetical protein